MRSFALPSLPLYLSLGALCVGIGIHALSLPAQPEGTALPKLTSVLSNSERLIAMQESSRKDFAELWAKAPGLKPHTESFVLGRGDTLNDVLQRAGFSSTTITSVVEAVRSLYNPKRMQVGQAVEVTYDPLSSHNELAATRLDFDVAPGHRVAVERQLDGAYAAKDVIAATQREAFRAEGVITSSLSEAAAQQRLPAEVMESFQKMFSYDVDWQRGIQRGDRFEVMFDRDVTTDGKPVRNGDIRYASLTLSGTTMRLFAFRAPDGQVDYYNDKGEGTRKALMRTPINGAALTSNFGMRKHPILGYSVMHQGVDFGAPTGTPIMAAGDGVIEMRGPNGSYGNYIRIRHSSGYSTAYAHMSRFGQSIAVGKRVRQGDIIGFVGATGRVTGPHLHFEMFRDAARVNPISVKFPAAMKLEGNLLARFRSERDSTLQQYATLGEPQVAEAPATNEP